MFDLEVYNKTECPYIIDRLDVLFDQAAAKCPENIAVKKGDVSITFNQLYEASERIADCIYQEYGLGAHIAITARKEWKTIAYMIGILKAGGCFIPINPDIPQERVNYILSNSNADVYIEDLNWYKNVLTKKIDRKKFTDIYDIAYIIFTSGSTGRPKGVMVSHAAAVNTIFGVNQTFDINVKNRYMSISSFSFDLSVYDIFSPLTAGSTLIIPEHGIDFKEYVKLMEKENITIWNSVPVILEKFLRYIPRDYSNDVLKVVMLSGDWIPLYIINLIKIHFPSANIYSLGGATEGGIWSIYYPVNAVDKEWKSIPYGYPLPNQKIYLFNDKVLVEQVGVEGEICIGGLSVANGYINNEKENTAFVKDPKYGELYKTGDYGVYRNNGYIELKGRKDLQYKIKGNRIELAEIDKVANEYSGVLKAVSDVKTVHDEKCIILYYLASQEFHLEELKVHIRENLPEYMCPLYYIKLEEIPVNQNEKVNRSLLPIPEITQNKDELHTDLEQQMIHIWEEVLEKRGIGLDSDFFELGGDSLQAQILVSEIKEKFKVDIDLRYLLEETTVRRACLCVANEKENQVCA